MGNAKLNLKGQLILDNYTSDCFVTFNGERIEVKYENGIYYCELSKDGLYLYHCGETEPEQVFSICKLRECLLNVEKDAIHKFLYTCNNTGKTCKEMSNIADFLLVSVFVLEQLICVGDYVEATRILSIINNGCGICDTDTKTLDCNCGKNS